MGKKDTSGKGRTRNFVTVVYPESAPEGWMELLADQCIPAFISPLHDSDENPTGEKKKEHHHVMIMFEGVKTTEQAQEIFDMIGGVGIERVNSLRGYARYLCHLDNPEKAQYETDSVRCLAGADYYGVIGLAVDKYNAIGDMMDFCIREHVYSYSDLLVHARDYRFDWFRILCDSGTLVMREFLKSLQWTETTSLED